jgi:hypothetical protein
MRSGFYADVTGLSSLARLLLNSENNFKPLAAAAQTAAARALARFSRRRCTDDGMAMASRYLATVRLAISTPTS